MNESVILGNLAKTDAITEEQYEKVVRVLAEIKAEKRHIKNRRSAADWEEDRNPILEDSRTIIQGEVLHELAFWIEMIVTGMAGIDKVALSLRREFGEQWYREWKNLVQNVEQRQLYAAGLAYEIIFGDANEDDFI